MIRELTCIVCPQGCSLKVELNGKNIISARSKFGLEDVPLLLIYCIDKKRGKESKTRCKIGTDVDVIGFSIIVSGESSGGSHAKTLTVHIPVE